MNITYTNTQNGPQCVPGGEALDGGAVVEIHLHNFRNTNTQNGHQSIPGGDAVESKDEDGASPVRPGARIDGMVAR